MELTKNKPTMGACNECRDHWVECWAVRYWDGLCRRMCKRCILHFLKIKVGE